MDSKIDFAIGTSESLSILTSSNGMTSLEPSMEYINISTDGDAFCTTSSSKTSIKTSDIPHTNPQTEEKIDIGCDIESNVCPFLNREVDNDEEDIFLPSANASIDANEKCHQKRCYHYS